MHEQRRDAYDPDAYSHLHSSLNPAPHVRSSVARDTPQPSDYPAPSTTPR